MYCYRITKYNPAFRNDKGWYVNDDWTAISDVGEVYNGNVFTFEHYLTAESAYVAAVRIAMAANHVSVLRFHGGRLSYFIYDYPDISKRDTKRHLRKLLDQRCADCSSVDFVVRCLLRESFGTQLVSRNMFVHFGYDYYMFIGSRKPLVEEAKIIEGMGLFVEDFPSPYMKQLRWYQKTPGM
jgi:hypothetical protein